MPCASSSRRPCPRESLGERVRLAQGRVEAELAFRSSRRRSTALTSTSSTSSHVTRMRYRRSSPNGRWYRSSRCWTSSAPSPTSTAPAGTETDAFDVAIPSMPGFGFSDHRAGRDRQLDRPGRQELMTRLGYTRYVQPGTRRDRHRRDGAPTPAGPTYPLSTSSAHSRPRSERRFFGDTFAMGLVKRAVVGVIALSSRKEPEALAGIERTFRAGYIAVMNTKPQTTGYGSTDPLAMAA